MGSADNLQYSQCVQKKDRPMYHTIGWPKYTEVKIKASTRLLVCYLIIDCDKAWVVCGLAGSLWHNKPGCDNSPPLPNHFPQLCRSLATEQSHFSNHNLWCKWIAIFCSAMRMLVSSPQLWLRSRGKAKKRSCGDVRHTKEEGSHSEMATLILRHSM